MLTASGIPPTREYIRRSPLHPLHGVKTWSHNVSFVEMFKWIIFGYVFYSYNKQHVAR